MRGTKKMPVEVLMKIHKIVLKKANESFSNDIKNLKKSDYNKHVSKEIYPNYADDSWFTRFESGLHKAEEFLAKYWVFQDLNQPVLESLHGYAELGELDEDRIKRYNTAFEKSYGSFISNKFFYDLESKSENLEVNCIAADLSWLNKYREKIVEAANEKGSVFKYLLVNPQARINLPIIKASFSNLKNKESIQIKEAYSQLKILNSKTEINLHEILFPLNDDIVIYKNIPQEIQDSQGVGKSMLAAGTDILDRNFERRKQDFIISDNTKLDYVQFWFDKIWESID